MVKIPANKLNYICVFTNSSQVYGCSSKEVALSTPPPSGTALEEKRVLFITFEPDSDILSVHMVPQEEVVNATIITKEKKKDE